LTSLRRLFKAVELFVTAAYKKPLWILMTLLFGSSITFLTSYESAKPEMVAKLYNLDNETLVMKEDLERMITLQNEFISVYGAFRDESREQILLALGAMKSGQVVDREHIKEIYRQIITIRNEQEKLIMKLNGTQFRITIHNERVEMFKKLLAPENERTKILEGVFAAYLNGNYDHHLQQLDLSLMTNVGKETKTSLALLESINSNARAATRAKMIELEKSAAQLRRDILIGYLEYPASIFCVGYIIAIGIGIRSSWRRSDKKQAVGISNRKKKRLRKRQK
jgi:hypothetical protein